MEFRTDRSGRVWVEPATQDLMKLRGLFGPSTAPEPRRARRGDPARRRREEAMRGVDTNVLVRFLVGDDPARPREPRACSPEPRPRRAALRCPDRRLRAGLGSGLRLRQEPPRDRGGARDAAAVPTAHVRGRGPGPGRSRTVRGRGRRPRGLADLGALAGGRRRARRDLRRSAPSLARVRGAESVALITSVGPAWSSRRSGAGSTLELESAEAIPMSLSSGSRLGPYEILAPLGAGGMGEVYRARDPRLGREVAIKVLPGGPAVGRDAPRRFVQEARAASSLNHPNIVTIHEIEKDGDVDFIVMELVPGKSLDKLIPKGGMPLGEALRLAIPLADALARAHARGHRPPRPQAGERRGERRRRAEGAGLRPRQAAVARRRRRGGHAHRGDGRRARSASRERSRARLATCRRSRPREARSMHAATSSASGRCCTRC